jgi:hypothetical protein
MPLFHDADYSVRLFKDMKLDINGSSERTWKGRII